jgi:hypothetical protein
LALERKEKAPDERVNQVPIPNAHRLSQPLVRSSEVSEEVAQRLRALARVGANETGAFKRFAQRKLSRDSAQVSSTGSEAASARDPAPASQVAQQRVDPNAAGPSDARQPEAQRHRPPPVPLTAAMPANRKALWDASISVRPKSGQGDSAPSPYLASDGVNHGQLACANAVLGDVGVDKEAYEAFKLGQAFSREHGPTVRKARQAFTKEATKFREYCEKKGFNQNKSGSEQVRGKTLGQLASFEKQKARFDRARTEWERVQEDPDLTVSRRDALTWRGLREEAEDLKTFLNRLRFSERSSSLFRVEDGKLSKSLRGNLQGLPHIPDDCDTVILGISNGEDGHFVTFERDGDGWICEGGPDFQGSGLDRRSPAEYATVGYLDGYREVSVITPLRLQEVAPASGLADEEY